MTEAATLRRDAETAASALPALLAQADHLAQTILLGDHGRRRAGMGDSFWQYRTAQPTDGLRAIDWRRSARSDDTFVQDKEWQIAQSVVLWVDGAASLHYHSSDDLPTKADRARVLSLATAILLGKGGERVGLTSPHIPPSRGTAQIEKLASALLTDPKTDYGAPDDTGIPAHARAVFVSDFMGDLTDLESTLTKTADRGVQGALLQILDPIEESFPFKGRTTFQSMTGATIHETLKADALQQRYLDRLAARKDRLRALARRTGWQFQTHHTNLPALTPLMWLHQSLSRQT